MLFNLQETTHRFIPTDLPYLPGGSKRHQVVACEHCGVLGHTCGDGYVRMMRRQPEGVHTCTKNAQPQTAIHARIVSPHLAARNPHILGLEIGTLHKAVEDTTNAVELVAWLYTPQPVRLYQQDYQKVTIRQRVRVR